ncbi:MAG TPA: DUF4238 domain-containing protein [Candidatus Microsaccharimonas sp.]|jgi:hypothetical protein
MTKPPPRFNTDDKLRTIHHFVPQSYLKRFARTDKPTQIWTYEINREPYSPSLEGIAGQRDFYTYKDTSDKETAELENVFADIDDKGANMLKVLDGLPDGFIDLPEDQKGDLYYYIAHLHTRNLQQRKQLAEAYGQMSKVQMQVVASDMESFHEDAKKALGDKYEKDVVERVRNRFLKGEGNIDFDPMSEHFIGATLQNAQDLYFTLMKLKKAALVSITSGSMRFITSDNPVTHYMEPGDPRRFMGVGYVNAVFQLPILPTRALLLIDDAYVIDDFGCSEDHVLHMNVYTCRYADKWVFSQEKSSDVSDLFNTHKAKGPLMTVDSPFDRSET